MRQQRAPQVEISTEIYMDDRSLVAPQAEALLSDVDAWATWSSSVGLQESDAKLQLRATSGSKL